MVRRHLSLIALMCVTAGLALPATAGASAFSAVLAALNASSTSTVPPCEFSQAELETALQEAPLYANEYDPGVGAAIKAAIDAQAANGGRGCNKHSTAAAGTSSPQRPASLTGGGALPGSVASHTASGLPLVVVIILILAAVAILGVGAGLLVSVLGWDPRVGRSAIHSLREAEYRLSAQWDDFADRLRRN